MYTEVTFFPDETAQIERYEGGRLVSRKTCLHGGRVLVWMVKQGREWTWHKDLDTGYEIAVMEE
jgi:hypothetical protein